MTKIENNLFLTIKLVVFDLFEKIIEKYPEFKINI